MEQFALYCWLKQVIEDIDENSFFSQISYNNVNKYLMDDVNNMQNQIGVYIHGGNGQYRDLGTGVRSGFDDRVQVLMICNSINNNDLQMQKIGMKLKRKFDQTFGVSEQINIEDGGVYKNNDDIDIIEFNDETDVNTLEKVSISISSIECGALNYVGLSDEGQVIYSINMSVYYYI